LVLKSTNFDDLNGHYTLCFKKYASFGAYHENLDQDRPTISAANMYGLYSCLNILTQLNYCGIALSPCKSTAFLFLEAIAFVRRA